MPITKATASSIAPAAKGDLVVGSATNDAAVLGVGSNDQVLTADSSTATGLKWATASSGGLTLLSTTTLSGTSTTISSIDQTYKHLLILGITITANSGDNINVRLNGDTGLNYQNNTINSTGTNQPGTSYNTADGSIQFITSSTSSGGGYNSCQFQMDIYRYTETEYKKINFTGSRGSEFTIGAGRYNSTTAISSITFLHSGTFNAGTIYIYGVK